MLMSGSIEHEILKMIGQWWTDRGLTDKRT
jgi:hypothetical protein